MISPGFVEDALACLRDQGIDQVPVLAAAGLPASITEPISNQAYGALWREMARVSGDEFFGLGTRRMRPGSFDLVCHAVLHAGTLEKALRQILRFFRVLLDDPSGKLIVQDGQAHVVLTDRDTPRRAFAHRTFWLFVMGISCWLIGRRIALRHVDFACAEPESRVDYRQFFGAPVQFDRPQSRLVFDAAYLHLPTIRTEQGLVEFLRQAPANILVRYRHDEGWAGRIRTLLRATPPQTWPVFETLATALGIAPATLRRRLREEGQSYSAIKDDLRNRRAQALLRQTELPVADIAADLGYSEPGAFHRAFRKWNDRSPGAYRNAP